MQVTWPLSPSLHCDHAQCHASLPPVLLGWSVTDKKLSVNLWALRIWIDLSQPTHCSWSDWMANNTWGYNHLRRIHISLCRLTWKSLVCWSPWRCSPNCHCHWVRQLITKKELETLSKRCIFGSVSSTAVRFLKSIPLPISRWCYFGFWFSRKMSSVCLTSCQTHHLYTPTQTQTFISPTVSPVARWLSLQSDTPSSQQPVLPAQKRVGSPPLLL